MTSTLRTPAKTSARTPTTVTGGATHRSSATSLSSPAQGSLSSPATGRRGSLTPGYVTSPSQSSLAVTSPLSTHRDANSSTMATTSKSLATTTAAAAGGSESVKVYVRVRDFNQSEKEKFIPSDLAVRMGGSTVEVTVPGRGKFPFSFDECFWSNSLEEEGKPYADQEDLYDVVGAPLVANVLSGFNSSIIAYGQTGSGKTYSIFGPSVIDAEGTKRGLIPRVCDGIFAQLAADAASGASIGTKHTVSVTMLEVYLEEVFDLLNARKKLTVRQDTATSFGVVGAKSCEVKSYIDVTKLIEKGDSLKTFAATAMNERSSRAHTLFQLVVSSVSPKGSRSAKVMLADLAGCERIKVSKTESGTALDEACNINLSLLTLGTCIEAAVQRSKQGRGIEGMGEFRQSTLTKLLKDFIGGNSRTAMLIAIAPGLQHVNLTLQALRFADRAKQIHTHAKINYTANKGQRDAAADEALRTLYDSKKELLDKEYQLEKAQSELSMRQEEVALAQIRLEEERKAIAERCRAADTSEEEKKMLQARVLDIESTMRNLTQELTDMEREKDALRERILEICNDNAAIVSDKEALERQVTELQARILELETDRNEELLLAQDQKASLEKDVEALEEKLKVREATYARLTREAKAAMEAEMAAFKATVEKERDAAVAEERAKYAALEGSHNASRQQCFSLTASLDKADKALQKLKADTDAAAEEAAASHARATEVLNAHFTAEANALKAQLAKAEAELAATAEGKAAAEATLTRTAAEHAAYKEGAEGRAAALEADLAGAKEAYEAQSAVQRSAIAALQSEQRAARSALAVTLSAVGGIAEDAVFAAMAAKEVVLFEGVARTMADDATAKAEVLATVEAAAEARQDALSAALASAEAQCSAHLCTIADRDAAITDLSASLDSLKSAVAAGIAREAELKASADREAQTAAAEAREAAAAHESELNRVKDEKAKAVEALEARIAELSSALVAAEEAMALEKELATAEAKEAAEASAAAAEAASKSHASVVASLEAAIAEREGQLATERQSVSALSASLAAEQERVTAKRKAIADLKAVVAAREAAMAAAEARHDEEADRLRAFFEKEVAETQVAHRRELAQLKTTAITAAQQQHHHAKMLASEAHQAQFMLQQAVAKFQNAMANTASLESLFLSVPPSRTPSSISLLASPKEGRSPAASYGPDAAPTASTSTSAAARLHATAAKNLTTVSNDNGRCSSSSSAASEPNEPNEAPAAATAA